MNEKRAMDSLSGPSRTALVCGVSGQDGAYLVRHLLGQNYRVYGTSRSGAGASGTNLSRLKVLDRMTLLSMAPNNFRSVVDVLDGVRPDEVYNLSGQSSVALSFEQPVDTHDSIVTATMNLLEGIRVTKRPIRFFNAGSSESFGDTDGEPANEHTPMRPRSPYAVAKAAAFWQVASYREAYGIHACTGILFNHESPLRPERFVTQKIVHAASRIAAGSAERLRLGNLDVWRDWGFAGEYVVAMWKMLQTDLPDDHVIATGETTSLTQFVATAFEHHGLDWRDHVDSDPGLLRPTDVRVSRADPGKARRQLGWDARMRVRDVIAEMSNGA